MATYKPLQSVQLTTTSSSLTFSGIDQSYTDLVFVADYTKSTNAGLRISVNGDTGTNYSQTLMYGDGSTAVGQRETNVSYFYAMDYVSSTSTVPNQTIIHFQNYSNTTTNKTFLDRSGNAANGTVLSGGLWRSTAAITNFTVSLSSGVFSAGSTFNLYGIKSGAPQALGGDVVVTDGNYWYHAFRNTGAFIPQRNLTADVLMIAGGGSGGSGGANFGGGGGAGGLLYTSSNSVAANSYTITVGAGGASVSQADGNNGSNSSFNSLTAVGGGGGAGTSLSAGTARAGKSGGSGGGATYWNSGTASGGAATSGQGNKGGDITSSVNNNRAGAGGGGAGVAGANVVTNGYGTAGGNGTNTYSSWASLTSTGVSGYYAGGGAGAGDGQAAAGAISGGLGGGGNAQWVVNGVAGVTNTGSGGGGSIDPSYVSGAGGSGLVIVRYPV